MPQASVTDPNAIIDRPSSSSVTVTVSEVVAADVVGKSSSGVSSTCTIIQSSTSSSVNHSFFSQRHFMAITLKFKFVDVFFNKYGTN